MKSRAAGECRLILARLMPPRLKVSFTSANVEETLVGPCLANYSSGSTCHGITLISVQKIAQRVSNRMRVSNCNGVSMGIHRLLIWQKPSLAAVIRSICRTCFSTTWTITTRPTDASTPIYHILHRPSESVFWHSKCKYSGVRRNADSERFNSQLDGGTGSQKLRQVSIRRAADKPQLDFSGNRA